MKKKLWLMVGLVLVVALTVNLFTGCSSSTDTADTGNEQTTTDQTNTTDDTSTTITVTDQVGRTVTLDDVPERIVSISPSNTEILYSLGLGDKIVGDTDYCDYPADALTKPKVGGYSTVDVEKVLAAEPDVIFGTDMHVDEILPTLEDLGLKVIILDPHNFDDILQSFTIIGQATGTETKAAGLVADMSDRIKAITDKTSALTNDQKPRTFYVMWDDPLMTVGGDTRISEMIEKAGGINMFADTEGYPTIDLETLVESDPQVIIAGSGMGEGADAPFTFAGTESRLASSDARQNDRVYAINTDLTGRPTERMIEGFEQMAKMIHPELFN